MLSHLVAILRQAWTPYIMFILGPILLICVFPCLQRALSPSRATTSTTPKGYQNSPTKKRKLTAKSPKPTEPLDNQTPHISRTTKLPRKTHENPPQINLNQTKMVRIRQHQGKLDGVEFLHGNPALTLVRTTPEAMRL